MRIAHAVLIVEEFFNLKDNRLTGSIPSELGRFRRLSELMLLSRSKMLG